MSVDYEVPVRSLLQVLHQIEEASINGERVTRIIFTRGEYELLKRDPHPYRDSMHTQTVFGVPYGVNSWPQP